MNDDRMMTPEMALRWLLELGSGPVTMLSFPKWVGELHWIENAEAGWLIRSDVNALGRVTYQLSQKSIDLIKELDNGKTNEQNISTQVKQKA